MSITQVTPQQMAAIGASLKRGLPPDGASLGPPPSSVLHVKVGQLSGGVLTTHQLVDRLEGVLGRLSAAPTMGMAEKALPPPNGLLGDLDVVTNNLDVVNERLANALDQLERLVG